MSFYGTILNNYPESYEPNLGKVQAIEEAFEDINTNISTNTTNIASNSLNINNINGNIDTIKSDINTIQTDLVKVNETIEGIRWFRTQEYYTDGSKSYRINLENVSMNDIVIVQGIAFERYGELVNYYPVITKVIYKGAVQNNYSPVSIYVEFPEGYGNPSSQDTRFCLQGLVIKQAPFNQI